MLGGAGDRSRNILKNAISVTFQDSKSKYCVSFCVNYGFRGAL